MAILDNTKVIDQTSAISKVPFKPGLMGALGMYRAETVGSDAISFDVRDNSFHVLDDHLRNVAQKNTTPENGFDIHTIAIPHYPVERTIGREKLAGVRGFNSQQEETVSAAVANELETQAEMHDLHEEFMLSQMTISGVVPTDHFGSIDMAAEFGVTRPTESFTYTNPGDTLASLRSAQKKAKAGLNNGGRVQGYIMLAGEDLFEWMIRNGDVVRAYELNLASPNPLLGELGEIANGYSTFKIGNTTVVLYDDSFGLKDGTSVQPLAADSGVLLPRTTLGRVFYGPESTLSGLGRGGAKRFARSYRDPKDRYIEVSSEQNTLPVLEQFGATVEISFTP
ncbi:major capsid protein [Halomonas sp. 25-S5]|uniref:major capsid protein n=1 Tax=Halomonas sp. 25-S5 TaxID=2994065 RepID=UPI002469A118|nr:major capsid protein [Halomonas sp. 25-S5]